MRRMAFAAGMAFATTVVSLQRGNLGVALITGVTMAVCTYLSITLNTQR